MNLNLVIYKENYENQNIVIEWFSFIDSQLNPSIINNCLIRSIFVNNVLIFEREREANEELFLGEKKKRKKEEETKGEEIRKTTGQRD